MGGTDSDPVAVMEEAAQAAAATKDEIASKLAADKAIFDKVTSGIELAREDGPDEGRLTAGRAEPDDDRAGGKGNKDKKEHSEESDEDAEGEDDEEEPQSDVARQALLRSGFTKREIAAMPQAEMLRRGLRRAKALEADDNAHRIARETSRHKEAGHEGTTNGAVPAPSAVDLKAKLKPFAEKLMLDDDAVAALAGAIEASNEPLRKQVTELAANATRDQEEATQEQAAAIGKARKELGERFSELADPQVYEEVLEQMKLMASGKKYRRQESAEKAMQALMADAAVALDLEEDESEEREEASQSRRTDERKQRARSRSTATSRSARPGTDPRERDLAVFRHVRRVPGDVIGARRAAGLA